MTMPGRFTAERVAAGGQGYEARRAQLILKAKKILRF